MKKAELVPFSPLNINLNVSVEYELNPKTGIFCFEIFGDTPRILWPPPQEPQNHSLWKHTCFELFEFDSQSLEYCEWNFTHLYEFDYFRFENYRKPATAQAKHKPPHMNFTFDGDLVRYQISLSSQFKESTWQPTLVIDIDGIEQSFWALEHSTNKPDFHKKIQGLHSNK